MCLTTSQHTSLIAKHNIRCYKVLRKDLVSPCYNQQYVLGQKLTSAICRYFRHIEEGLHTYVNFGYAKDRTRDTWFNQIELLPVAAAPIVVECIIPQGSEYYISNNGEEYASNQLIPNKIVYIRV